MIGFCRVQSADEAAPQPSPPSDAQIIQKIVGTWLVELSGKGATLKGTETFLADGKIVSKYHITGIHGDVDVVSNSTWQVKDGVLTETLTETSNPKMETVGTTSHRKIIRVDDEELVYQKENGGIATRKRSK